MLQRFHSHIGLGAIALLVGFFFIVPDLTAWWRIDGFKTPIRDGLGDYAHYLTHLHRLQVEGVSGSSMFTWEHRQEPSRLIFFERLMKALPGFSRITTIWWLTILKFFASLAVFLGLYGIFRACDVEKRSALLFALASAFFYNPYATQAPALASWFLMFFLAGLAAFMLAAVHYAYTLPVLVASIFFLVASGMHVVYALVGMGVGGLWWLIGIARKTPERRVWLFALLWGGAALACFWIIFGDYVGTLWSSSHMVSGYLERNGYGSLPDRVPLFPLLAAKFILIALACFVGYRQSRTDNSATHSRRWLVLLLLSLIPLFANIQNVFTGVTFLAVHFAILEEFVVLPAAVIILFASSPDLFRGSKTQRLLGIAMLVVTSIFAVSLMIDRPIRSWAVLGRWVPLITGYVVVGGWLVFPRQLRFLATKVAVLLPAIAIAGVAYASVFLWRSYVHDAPGYIAAQRYRDVFSVISRLPPGVLMASPEISEIAALYTPQRVYWARMNGQFGGTYEEFAQRLQDERLIFEGDMRLGEEFGSSSIFGSANVWCNSLTEKLFYQKIRSLGIADVTVCNTARSDRDWPRYLAEYARVHESVANGSEWTPPYRLDWLVVDESKDSISGELIRRYFKQVERVGDFAIYRYRSSTI